MALELIYAIGTRLQRLFAALASKIQALLHATVRRGQRHRNVSIYALEIIYRGMKKCGTLNWGLSEDHVLHPMVSISATTLHCILRVNFGVEENMQLLEESVGISTFPHCRN